MVLDVGGAAGSYAFPLADEGYQVHLVDPVPLHVEQAQQASGAAQRPLTSVVLGDARDLPFGDSSADAVLLMGPLYHLPDPADRLQALREATRVLRPGGVLIAAAINRFASAVDAMVAGFVREADFEDIVAVDMTSGLHRNRTARPGWFTTAYFHRPEELHAEVVAVGLEVEGPVAVEGIARLAPDLDSLLDDPATRRRILRIVRATEGEQTLIGASGHLLAAGRKAR